MKLTDLKEMAVRGGDLTSLADSWAEKLRQRTISNIENTKLLGMLDDLEVRQHIMTVTVWKDSDMVAAAKIDALPNKTCVIDDVWVKSAYRRQNMFTKLLLFMKVNRGFKRIVLADVHSDDTYNLLKSGGLKPFRKSWENRNGETEEFSTETIDKFYGAGKWKLVLENEDEMSCWIKPDSFTHSYAALAEAVNTHESF